MNWLTDVVWHNGNLFGIEWTAWKVVGWLGNTVFFSRFLVQWYATEKQKKVVVPVAFWYLSIVGSWLLLSYALFYRADSVFIFANAFNWIPYFRSLIIHHRHKEAHVACGGCGHSCAPDYNFCPECGRNVKGRGGQGELAIGA